MRSLSKPVAILLLLSIATVSAADALQEMIAAERTFARRSVDSGMRDAFLFFLAPDSIVLSPEPVNGAKFYRSVNISGRTLFWQPVFATIARSGDLGLSTGPWEERDRKTGKDAPVGFGQFVSVWRKSGPEWKVAIDAGNKNSQPTDAPDQLATLLPLSGDPKIDAGKAQHDLALAEQDLAGTLKEGAGAAITVAADGNIRVIRDDAFPAIGRDAAKLMLSSDNGKMERKTLGGMIATSADLAFRYGSYVSQRANVTERGYFLTAWRLEADGEWRILLDLQNRIAGKNP